MSMSSLPTPEQQRSAPDAGKRRARLRVGTAAWADHLEFYPRGLKPSDRIAYYARHFSVVEVNASYYHIMPARNYSGWVEKTPDDFVFNVKAYGVLTGHQRGEEATPEVFAAFRASYAPFVESGKLGAVLFGFPPWFDATDRNRDTIARCVEQMADDPLLIEFRNVTWLTDPEERERTFAFLRELGLSYVTVDAPQVGTGTTPLFAAVTNRKLAYLRMHGRNEDTWYKRVDSTSERFNYRYNEDEIADLAQVALQLLAEADEAHIIFNNNMADFAVANARMMLNALDEPVNWSEQQRLF